MKQKNNSCPRRKLTILLVFGVLLGVVTQSDGKTVSSSSSSSGSSVTFSKSNKRTSPKTLQNSDLVNLKPENVFVRLAKSVAYEAINELREESRRNPRFGMSLDFGNLTSIFANLGNSTVGNGTDGLEGIAALAGIPVAIKVSSLGLKGAILGGLVGIKAFIIQLAISLLWLAFLISGTAYFVCNLGLVNCGQGLGGLGGGGGGLGGLIGGGGSGHSMGGGSSFFGGSGPSASPPYGSGGGTSGSGSSSSSFSNPLSFFSSRQGAAAMQQLQEQATPIYKAIDEGYKKYQ